MMKKNLRLKFLLLLIFFQVPVLQASRVSEISCSLWPDYDRPGMTAILEIQMDVRDTFLLQLPPAVSRAHLTEGYLNPEVSMHPDKDGILRFYPEGTNFTLKYYDPFPPEPLRIYTYTLSCGLPADTIYFFIQKPASARNFRVPPDFESAGRVTDETGREYLAAVFADLPAWEPLTVQIRYTNPDQQLTAPAVTAIPPPVRQTLSPAARVIGYGVLIVGAVLAVMLWSSTRKKGLPGSGKPAGDKRFCAYCGAPRDSVHSFCPYCGKKY